MSIKKTPQQAPTDKDRRREKIQLDKKKNRNKDLDDFEILENNPFEQFNDRSGKIILE